MSILDDTILELSSRLRVIPVVLRLGFLWGSGKGLLEAVPLQNVARSELDAAYLAVRRWLVSSPIPKREMQLAEDLVRDELDSMDPKDFEEIPDGVLLEGAYLALDVCFEHMVGNDGAPEYGVEYVLTPVVSLTTLELFGVLEPGSQDEEEEMLSRVSSHPRVKRAVRYCKSTVDRLMNESIVTESLLNDIAVSASCLAMTR
jgi:hypothetical protein